MTKKTDLILQNQDFTTFVKEMIMKSGSDNFRSSAVQGIIEKLQAKSIEVVIYEPVRNDDIFEGLKVIKNIDEFKSYCDVIVANRMEDAILDLKEKVYTRDVFGGDK